MIAKNLKLAISIGVFGVAGAIFTPVARMVFAPSLGRRCLISLVVGILGKLFPLPIPFAGALTGSGGAILLVWDMRAWQESMIASLARSFLHGNASGNAQTLRKILETI